MQVTVERAVAANQIVAALRRYGFTQVDIARAVGVSERAVRNWSNDAPVRRANEERLQTLREVVVVLAESLTPRGVGQWFRARNRLLGGQRPLDVFSAGNANQVREAAEAFADGAYV